jgi:hypothetical protein
LKAWHQRAVKASDLHSPYNVSQRDRFYTLHRKPVKVRALGERQDAGLHQCIDLRVDVLDASIGQQVGAPSGRVACPLAAKSTATLLAAVDRSATRQARMRRE